MLGLLIEKKLVYTGKYYLNVIQVKRAQIPEFRDFKGDYLAYSRDFVVLKLWKKH